jgi:hypothetical protein
MIFGPSLVIGSYINTNEYIAVTSVLVQRHGVRSPYPAPEQTNNSDYSLYTARQFPSAQDWGMTEYEYNNQYLTPHGRAILPKMGKWYKDYYKKLFGTAVDCSRVSVFSDNSIRDIDTAKLLVQDENGLNCPSVDVIVPAQAAFSNYADLAPVLSDNTQVNNCPVATETQVTGLYGGFGATGPDASSLTSLFETGIDFITNDLLQMGAYNASICAKVNPTGFSYNADGGVGQCGLNNTGYVYTGQYYEGMFKSPFYYAGYFAETLMFQYLSNLPTVGFDILTNGEEQLANLYTMHQGSLVFGTNIFNGASYASQQLGYVVASLQSYVQNSAVTGVRQAARSQLTFLVCHDTNILYLRQLLNLNWVPDNNPKNVATTGGSLSFQLFRRAGAAADSTDEADYSVLLVYTAASPEQQRQATTLSLGTPPAQAQVLIPKCGEIFCPFATFKQVALDAISLNCVTEPLQVRGGENDHQNCSVVCFVFLFFLFWWILSLFGCAILFLLFPQPHPYNSSYIHLLITITSFSLSSFHLSSSILHPSPYRFSRRYAVSWPRLVVTMQTTMNWRSTVTAWCFLWFSSLSSLQASYRQGCGGCMHTTTYLPGYGPRGGLTNNHHQVYNMKFIPHQQQQQQQKRMYNYFFCKNL